jgi:very-short-patch-repair endonuclease
MAKKNNVVQKLSLPSKKAESIISGTGAFKTGNSSIDKTGSQIGYGKGAIAHTNYKTAQTGANVTYTNPMFFSPLHTPQNWQIASKLRETFQWARFYYRNERKIGAGIDFYSTFPLTNFALECKSKKTLKFYEKLIKDLKLPHWLRMISHEYYLLGNVYIFMEFDCKVCGGTGINQDGNYCNHPGGKPKRIMVLNPDWIEVQSNVLADEPLVVLLPDEELRSIVARKQPAAIYNKLPKRIIEAVLAGMPIPLSNRSVTHLKHAPSPYGVYGDSILRRLFTILAYKTKLMTANWIVAERLILPIRVVKIGSPERPAGDDDIASVTSQLAVIANDPNLTLVTHHAFDMDFVGATGKIHNINQELEYVGKEILDGLMLNQALLNGEGPSLGCNDTVTRVLTKDGFKFYDEVTEDDLIACFNKDTEELEYHKYIKKFVYDYEGDMYHFKTNNIDVMVTPNHRMLAQKRNHDNWEVIKAEDIASRAKFRRTLKWEDGVIEIPEEIKDKEELDNILKIYAYFATEGCFLKNRDINSEKFNEPVGIKISQTINGNAWDEIHDLKSSCKTYNMRFRQWKEKTGQLNSAFYIYNHELGDLLKNDCGEYAKFKKLPQWIKNLPVEYLNKVIEYMLKGDGSCRDAQKIKQGKFQYKVLITTSPQLRDDFMEISLKCGYAPKYSKNKGKKSHHADIYHVMISDFDKFKNYYGLESKAHNEITKVPYKDKVWCFSVPTKFFITERNGKIGIHGNSAQVGLESMIKRLDVWRSILSEWIEERIFLPTAMMQGFIDEDATKEAGHTVYDYPKIKWDDMNLRDNSSHLQMMNQLHDKKVISTQQLLREFDIDYDRMIEEMREEGVVASRMGGLGAGGQQGAGGSMGAGGLGGLGGGMDLGGGAGGLGGAPTGAPGLGGADMGAGGGLGGMGADTGMGGAPAGGGMGGRPAGGTPATAMASPLLITKRGKAKKRQEEVQRPPQKFIRFTNLEQALYKTLLDLNIPYQLFGQYQVHTAGTNNHPYLLDFAYPKLGIAVERDGPFHNTPERLEKDKNRDVKLANLGWTILRFNEEAISDNIDQVKKVIYETIVDAIKHQKKKANIENDFIKTANNTIICNNDIYKPVVIEDNLVLERIE